MENHDEAYRIWRASGKSKKTLVHIDAHDDLWWTADQDNINIANFISLGLRDEIIREIFWVVPDQTWESPSCLRALRRRLKKVLKSYPGNSVKVRGDSGQISAAVLGKPVRVCTLGNLPRIEGNVLLDIDVDFLTIRQACRSFAPPEALPWCWPGEFIERLKAREVASTVITIAYSVEGGYTPLKWKYLGDELALRLGLPRESDDRLRGMELMRVAALAAHRGDLAAAERHYLEAQELWPGAAVPEFHLAQLYLEMGKMERAAASYQKALHLDPSYRTPYNNGGPWYYAIGRFREAEAEYRRTLALDPDDAYANWGLGRLAARRRRYDEAESWLRQALTLDPNLLDAHRTLGKVQAKRGRIEEAIAAYEKSMILALRGFKPLTEAIATDFQGLLDPDHFRIHGRLARLYDLKGEVGRAINGYRMAIAKGGDGVFPRLPPGPSLS